MEGHREDDDAAAAADRDAATLRLPGSYEAGFYDSGVDHSLKKLKQAEQRLKDQLQRIPLLLLASQTSTDNTTVVDTGTHGQNGTSDRSSIGDIIETLPCAGESSTWSYRCRCNFQIIRTLAAAEAEAVDDQDQEQDQGRQNDSYHTFAYAMREQGQPVEIKTFPIGTRRIQHAMKLFLTQVLNNFQYRSRDKNNMDFTAIKTNLSSCTFSSSWKDIDTVDTDTNGNSNGFGDTDHDGSDDHNGPVDSVDCILTLNYDQPFRSISSKSQWKHEAQHVCHLLQLRRLNGRSKGVLLSVGPSSDHGQDNKTKDTGLDSSTDRKRNTIDDTGTIRDVVYLISPDHTISTNKTDKKSSWAVTLTTPTSSRNEPEPSAAIPVLYEKPESAFYHPNASAMIDALTWMLNRLDAIRQYNSTTTSSSSIDSNHQNSHSNHHPGSSKLNILEMYCGCGAHTVALGKSTMVDQILAVELDPRLVTACEHNVTLNGLDSVVKSQRGDAGTFAREWQRSRRRRRHCHHQLNDGGEEYGTKETSTTTADKTEESRNVDYDVLLVDPPRQGLDEQVTKMAIDITTFQDFLYISCGHFALLRDLERLAPAWQVVQITQLDLFPRTGQIETLVHLRRRRK